MTKRITRTVFGLVLAFGLAAQSHATWMLIGSDTIDNQGTGNTALGNFIKDQKDDENANINLIGDGNLEDGFGGPLTLDPGTVNLTLHYGNYGGDNNVTVLYMCDGNDCGTFDFGAEGETTKGLSNYRAYGTSVPEPGTLALLGAGLLGLGVLRRRRANA